MSLPRPFAETPTDALQAARGRLITLHNMARDRNQLFSAAQIERQINEVDAELALRQKQEAQS